MAEPLVCSIEAVTHGRFLLRVPSAPPPYPLLVGFHGYGENAERHLDQLGSVPATDAWMLASVQGLHRFYTAKMEEVVASWMTRQDREQAIADNVAYVDQVVEVIRREYETNRLVFAGFSQGVAMAFRAAVRGSAPPDGVIALGGDVPPDVRDQPASRFGRVLLGRGARDTWYTEEKLRADVTQLESMGVKVEAVVFDGGHEWTDEFRHAAARFLQSLAP
jgi:predicted esterase